MKRVGLGIFILLVGFAFWWLYSAPPPFIHIGPPLELDIPSSAVTKVTTSEDVVGTSSARIAPALPGYDEVLLFEDEGIAYATGIDGWLWKIDLSAGRASKFIDVPLMAAGARKAPDNADRIYFCASRLYGETYPQSERVGLYQLDLQSKHITPLVLEVPKVDNIGGEPKVYPENSGPQLRQPLVANDAARPLAFCNDLDVSADGQRIYFTEPFSYGSPGMGGGGTYREAVSLGQNGLVWRYDFEKDAVSLVAQNFSFPDGILVEATALEPEQSLLVAETIKFQIQRMFLSGPRAGQSEIVQKNLPAMPDGMDRDASGNIWVGMIKQRSDVVDWIHRNPWIKPLLLRLPSTMMPVSRETSYMALSADAGTPLFYTVHDGSVLSEISVVIPGKDQLFLATVGHDTKGLYRVPYPDDMN